MLLRCPPVDRLLAVAIVFGGLGTGGVYWDVGWHRNIGRDTFWSPPHLPHLLAVAGAGLMVLGIVAAVAGRARAGQLPPWLRRLLLAFLAADLLQKAMFSLSHSTVDPYTRTPDYYPFLTRLLTAAVAVGAVRALGPGWAAASAGIHLALAGLAILLLRAINVNTPTLSPLLLVPALAVDGWMALWGRRRDRWPVAVAAGVGYGLLVALTEAVWMALVVGKSWPAGAMVAGLPQVPAGGALSGWIGWAVGGFVRGLASPGSGWAVFGGPRRGRLVLAGAVAASLVGLLGAYRPEPLRPPASLARFGLVAGDSFDYVDTVFWDAALPDDWWRPGRHAIRSEGVVGGLRWPIGPGWCARDERTLEADLARIRFALSVNGERRLRMGVRLHPHL